MYVSRPLDRIEVESAALIGYAALWIDEHTLEQIPMLVRVCQIICPQLLEPALCAAWSQGEGLASGHGQIVSIGRAPQRNYSNLSKYQ